MATKPEFIQQFEEKTRISLKQISLEEIKVNEKLPQLFGKRTFSVDDNNNIIALSMDFVPQFLWIDLPWDNLQNLKYLSCNFSAIPEYTFLKHLNSITSLSCSGNYIKDISFLKNLKGLNELNLSHNNSIKDFSIIKELKELNSLDLSSNSILDFSFLKELDGLKSLNLSSNNFQNISFLKELKGLKSLNLKETWVKDFSFLKEIKNLNELSLDRTTTQDLYLLKDVKELSLRLWSNKIQDITILKEFKGLKSLTINLNNVKDSSSLEELKGLKKLFFQSGNIQDISFIEEFKELKSLGIIRSNINNISIIKELKNLRSLYIKSTKIKDFSFLKELKDLNKLDLGQNSIQDISFIKDLRRLKNLSLIQTGIQDISFLKDLQEISILYLTGNRIQDASFLGGLNELSFLSVGQNKIQDISFLKNLKELYWLDLSSNEIHDISPIKQLSGLTRLDLSSNHIHDISSLSKLNALANLNLERNKIQDISFLQDFKGVRSINLASNQIQDISILSQLKNINWLGLRNNKIHKVPEELFSLDINLSIKYNLSRNPIQEPPIEILKEGKEAILSYFRSLRKSRLKLLNEVKVLIVGEGMAGKTSVLKQLKGLKFNKHESQTHGINIETLQLPEFKRLENDELTDIKAHFWDFGGQEVMHASHRFFLSQRSLYILILDSRTDNKKDYWLKHISSFGGDAPTIVVINKIDDNAQYDVERKTLNKKYPFIENRFHRISCANGMNIQNLKDTIADSLAKTSLFGTPISSNWLKVKDELIEETKSNRYINKSGFERICINNEVIDLTEQNTLLHFLNDLGIILHFDDLNLEDVFVLDPHWVTVGVYRIINSAKIQKGILNTIDLDYILNEETIKRTEYDPNKSKYFRYNPQERNYVIQVMKEFELCYELNKNELLIPDLLNKEPDFEINFYNDDVLRFNFKYDFIHPSILSRLIIQLKNDIPDKKLWRYGMQLINETSEAFVKADLDEKTISICVYGDKLNRRHYFSVLRHALKEINNSFENLEVSELIPLPSFPDNSVSYTTLLNHEKSERDFYYDGDLDKEFRVEQLLDGIFSVEQREKDYTMMQKKGNEKNVNVSVNVSPQFNPTFNNEIRAKAEAVAKAEAKNKVSISIEIQNFLGETEMLKEDIKDELEIEGVPEKEIKLVTRDVEVAEKAIKEIELANKEKREPKPASKTRLGRFINDLGDETSTINKTLKILRKGRNYGVQLAEMYNTIAQNTGMPSVPPLVLNVIKKI